MHAERGGVDQDAGIARAPRQLAPGIGRNTCAKKGGDLLGARLCAIEQAHFADTDAEQGVHDGTCRTTSAQNQGNATLSWAKGRRGCGKVAQKAGTVGVVAGQLAVLVPKRVGGANGPRRRMLAHRRGERRFLVRQGDIAAGKTARTHVSQECGDVARPNRLPLIAADDAVFAEPIAVNQRRARMRNRPADDTGFAHAAIMPRARSSVSRGSSGSPTMLEAPPRTEANSWMPLPSIS